MAEENISNKFPAFTPDNILDSPNLEEEEKHKAKRKKEKQAAKDKQKYKNKKMEKQIEKKVNEMLATPAAASNPQLRQVALEQIQTEAKLRRDEKVAKAEVATERKRKRNERRQNLLLKYREGYEKIAQGQLQVLQQLGKTGEELQKVRGNIEKNQEAVEKTLDVEDDMELGLESKIEEAQHDFDQEMERIAQLRYDLYASTPSHSAVTSPASSRSESPMNLANSSPVPARSLAGTFEGAAQYDNKKDDNTKPQAMKTPMKHKSTRTQNASTAKKPSPVAENEESKMPTLTKPAPVILLASCKHDGLDIVDTNTIWKQIGGEGDTVGVTPALLGLEQVGTLSFAIVAGSEFAEMGTLVCLGPPGFFSSVGHALVGRHPDFTTKIHVMKECGNNVVCISAYGKADNGILAVLCATGETFIFHIFDKKVTLEVAASKEDWLPDNDNKNVHGNGVDDDNSNGDGADNDNNSDDNKEEAHGLSDLTLTTIKVGSDFAATMDSNGNFHVMYRDTTNGNDFGHFNPNDLARIDPEAGFACGEDSVLAWAEKIDRNRTRRVFFFSESTENPWANPLAAIKGITPKTGVASQSGFLALGLNGSSYISLTGDSWKRVDWGKGEAVKSSLIAATDDSFLAIPDGKPGCVLLVSSDSPQDSKSKTIKASLVDLSDRLKESGKEIKEALLLAGSSSRICLCAYVHDLSEEVAHSKSAGNVGEAMGDAATATDGTHK